MLGGWKGTGEETQRHGIAGKWDSLISQRVFEGCLLVPSTFPILMESTFQRGRQTLNSYKFNYLSTIAVGPGKEMLRKRDNLM